MDSQLGSTGRLSAVSTPTYGNSFSKIMAPSCHTPPTYTIEVQMHPLLWHTNIHLNNIESSYVFLI